MRILIMNPILYTSETDEIPRVKSIKDTMIYTLCMGFVKNGDEPVLIAADCYKPTEKEEYPFQALWFPCTLPRIFKPRCLPMLKGLGKYLRKNKQEYDYIISSEVFSLVTLAGALYAKNKMLIWHELGNHNHLFMQLPSKLWYNVIAKLFMHRIPVVPRSERAAEFISKYCDHVLSIRIDHGIDLDKIPYSREKENYFVVLSQLIERKHIDGIIKRFAEFRKEYEEPYRLLIIGDGVLRTKLETQVKELGEEESVLFRGKMDHEKLMPVLARAKALLINTSKDNSMVSIVESIGAGTPVITTSVPFNSSYIRQENLGIVKDEWGLEELKQICADNAFYVENCIHYREKISNRYFAKQFDRVGGSL